MARGVGSNPISATYQMWELGNSLTSMNLSILMSKWKYLAPIEGIRNR